MTYKNDKTNIKNLKLQYSVTPLLRNSITDTLRN